MRALRLAALLALAAALAPGPARAGRCLSQAEALRARYPACEAVAFAFSCPAGEEGKRELILSIAMAPEADDGALRCAALALGMEGASMTAGAEEVFAARLGEAWPAWKAWMEAERAGPPLWEGHPSPFARAFRAERDAPRALVREAQEDAAAAAGAALDALGDADPRTRRRALAVLANLRYAGPPASLLARLDDADASVRFAAAEAAGRLAPPEAKAALEARLGVEKDDFVRGGLVRALGAVAGAEDVARLRLLVGAENRWEALAAARALGRLGSAEACGPVGELLEHGKDQVGRMLEVALIGAGLADCRAQVPLIAPYAENSQGMIRKAALFALATIGDEASLAALRALRPERLAELPEALRPR